MANLSTMLRLLLTVTVMAATCNKMAEACSCLLTHVQDHYCKADFVIVARVTRHNLKKSSYKIRVKREFKTNEKVSAALKSGRVVTPPEDSMCGIHLAVNETYVMAGRVVAGSARIGLCDYVKPWHQVTNRQRKGFNQLYKLACSKCEIVSCPPWRTCPADKEVCYWSTRHDVGLPDCQSENSVCMLHSHGSCGWTQDRQYRECMKKRKMLSDARDP